MRLLVSWIGNTDLRAPRAENKADVGPIAQALAARKFDRILPLADQEPAGLRSDEGWLRARGSLKPKVALKIERVELTSPTNFDEIYRAATSAFGRL